MPRPHIRQPLSPLTGQELALCDVIKPAATRKACVCVLFVFECLVLGLLGGRFLCQV